MIQILVMAKAPVPGRVKTRLCPPCTPAQAAAIAAAALGDTLDTAARVPAVCHTLVIDGAYPARSGWTQVPQRGQGLGERLANAFADTALPGVPALLLGMDTPQVTGDLLRDAAAALCRSAEPGRSGAVLGPAEDGGWWVLGLSDPGNAEVLPGVPMSTAGTADLTLAALNARGVAPVLLPRLRDVDTAADALAVAAICPPGHRFPAAVAHALPHHPPGDAEAPSRSGSGDVAPADPGRGVALSGVRLRAAGGAR